MLDEITIRNKLKKFYKEFETKLSEIKQHSISEDEANNYLLALIETALSYFPYLDVDEMIEESGRAASALPPSNSEIASYLVDTYGVSQKESLKEVNKCIKSSLNNFEFALAMADESLGEVPLLNFSSTQFDAEEIRDLKVRVFEYSDATILKKVLSEDCYDLMLDSFFCCFSTLDFGKLTYDTPPRVESANRELYPVPFQYPIRWIKFNHRSFLGGDTKIFYMSDIVGPIYSGIERYFKFPNALKANYELGKIENFKTTIKEINKKNGNS
jgi:hypothetical protein